MKKADEEVAGAMWRPRAEDFPDSRLAANLADFKKNGGILWCSRKEVQEALQKPQHAHTAGVLVAPADKPQGWRPH